MPVTQTRLEGYFRLEWRLAVERSHLMADGKTFIVPVTIDAIEERQGDAARALEALRRARLVGDPDLQGMEVDPLFARIHDGPGFKALIAQLNFPETGRMPSSVDVRK